MTVLALKELFDVVFKQFTKAEKAKLEAVKSISESPAPAKVLSHSSLFNQSIVFYFQEAIVDLLDGPLPAPEPVPVVSSTNVSRRMSNRIPDESILIF